MTLSEAVPYGQLRMHCRGSSSWKGRSVRPLWATGDVIQSHCTCPAVSANFGLGPEHLGCTLSIQMGCAERVSSVPGVGLSLPMLCKAIVSGFQFLSKEVK